MGLDPMLKRTRMANPRKAANSASTANQGSHPYTRRPTHKTSTDAGPRSSNTGHDEIARRAFEIYVSRGEGVGRLSIR